MSALRPLRSDWGTPTIACGGNGDGGQGPESTARTQRPLVGRTGRDRDGPRRLRFVLGLRGSRRHELLLRAVPLAALFALPQRELRASDAAAHRYLLESLARDPHRRVPARLPGDLLLLPPLVLPRVLLVPAGVRGARCAHRVRRRGARPAPPAKPPPLRARIRTGPPPLPPE